MAPIAPLSITLSPRPLPPLQLPCSCSVPSIFTPSSFKILSKLELGLSSLNSRSHLTSSFVRNIALLSDLEDLDAAEAREQTFSSDLKVFDGNLSFEVNSGEQTTMFQRDGIVEHVEVIYDKATVRS